MTLSVGWEEWVSLPDLGIPAIRAKVDTGAQTSSIHAFSIHPFEQDGKDRVRFGLHPVVERSDIELYCEADLVGQRAITSSNGETELRYIITSNLSVGGQVWPIELSLANRETMAYRMLLGRRALEAGVLVDVTRSCIHGEPDLQVYDDLPHARAAKRTLAIALLASDPDSSLALRLTEAAKARGHVVHILDVHHCHLAIENGRTTLYQGDTLLPPVDAVLPCLRPVGKESGLAFLRALEVEGVHALNSPAALMAVWDRLFMCQRLAQRGVRQPRTGYAANPDSNRHMIERIGGAPLALRFAGNGHRRGMVVTDSDELAQSVLGAFHGLDAQVLVQHYIVNPRRRIVRCLMAGRRVLCALYVGTENHKISSPVVKSARPTREERRLASRAMAALNLQMGVVDLVTDANGPMVVDVEPLFDPELFESASGEDVASGLIAHLEERTGRKIAIPR